MSMFVRQLLKSRAWFEKFSQFLSTSVIAFCSRNPMVMKKTISMGTMIFDIDVHRILFNK